LSLLLLVLLDTDPRSTLGQSHFVFPSISGRGDKPLPFLPNAFLFFSLLRNFPICIASFDPLFFAFPFLFFFSKPTAPCFPLRAPETPTQLTSFSFRCMVEVGTPLRSLSFFQFVRSPPSEDFSSTTLRFMSPILLADVQAAVPQPPSCSVAPNLFFSNVLKREAHQLFPQYVFEIGVLKASWILIELDRQPLPLLFGCLLQFTCRIPSGFFGVESFIKVSFGEKNLSFTPHFGPFFAPARFLIILFH